MFPGPLGESLAGKALTEGVWSLEAVDIRRFAKDRHGTVDDAPFGGGAGMVLKPDILSAAIEAIAAPGVSKILLSPRGAPFTQARGRELAAGPGVLLVCGRFEGVDERVIEAHALEEVSVGDFVLSGGEASRSPVMLPFTDEAVPEIDVEGGKVLVDPPAGLLAGGKAKEA